MNVLASQRVALVPSTQTRVKPTLVKKPTLFTVHRKPPPVVQNSLLGLQQPSAPVVASPLKNVLQEAVPPVVPAEPPISAKTSPSPSHVPLNPSQKPLVTIESFVVSKLLGAGAQGSVYLAKSRNERITSLFAIKMIDKRRAAPEIKLLLQEQRILKKTRGHPFLLEMVASFHDFFYFYLVTVGFPFVIVEIDEVLLMNSRVIMGEEIFK